MAGKKISKFEKKLEKKILHWIAIFFSITLLTGYITGYSQPDKNSQRELAMLVENHEQNKKATMEKLNYEIRHFSVKKN